MADEKRAQAKRIFDAICAALDGRNWKYEPLEDELKVKTGATGNDLPMNLLLHADEGRQLLLAFSVLPFNAPEDKRVDFAIAISLINDRLVDGSFDYDIRDGRVVFRLTSSFLETDLGVDAINYMISCSLLIVDAYNDKLLLLANGDLTLEQFIEKESN